MCCSWTVVFLINIGVLVFIVDLLIHRSFLEKGDQQNVVVVEVKTPEK